MKYKNQIAYDFDGVLCSTMPAFHAFWKEEYNWDIWDDDNRTFEMPMPEGYDFKHISKDIEDALNKYQSYLRPHAFAMEMVRELARKNNETPIIISARGQGNAEVTDAWLKDYLGIPFTLVLIGGDYGDNKPDIINKYGLKYFVEDRFKTCNSIVQKTDVKACFMPDRVWNGGRTPLDDVIKVNNMLDVWDWIAREEEE